MSAPDLPLCGTSANLAMMEEQPFRWGDVYAFVDQQVIMLKAVTDEGDPDELTDDAAEALAHWLLDCVRQHRG